MNDEDFRRIVEIYGAAITSATNELKGGPGSGPQGDGTVGVDKVGPKLTLKEINTSVRNGEKMVLETSKNKYIVVLASKEPNENGKFTLRVGDQKTEHDSQRSISQWMMSDQNSSRLHAYLSP